MVKGRVGEEGSLVGVAVELIVPPRSTSSRASATWWNVMAPTAARSMFAHSRFECGVSA